MTVAYVALGSNLGDRRGHIDAALRDLGSTPGCRLIAASPIIETDPVGPVPQGRFLNAAVGLETSLGALELLRVLQGIERSRGRDRGREERWGPRTLDLDLLLYGEAVINEAGLTVPHPRMHERRFVLEPLARISPDHIIPGIGRTVADALRVLGTAPADTGTMAP